MSEGVVIGLIGVSGIIAGSIITILGSKQIAKENHRYESYRQEKEHKKNLERLEKEQEYKKQYLREEIFFKKKLEYFERVLNGIGKMVYDYTTLISLSPATLNQIIGFFGIENPKIDQRYIKNEIQKISEKILDKERLNSFLPEGQSLYLTNLEYLNKINSFSLTHSKIGVKLKELILAKKELSEELINLLNENTKLGEEIRILLQKEVLPHNNP